MRRILMFMGTRPEAIKMAPVIHAVRNAAELEAVVISTGQHREMIQQVIDLFGIAVDHELSVMQPNQTLSSLTARLLTGISELLSRIEADMVLVQGDTTTAMVAGLAAFYRRIPVGHVEAGLRTGDIWAPFPEEVNRRVIGLVTSLHFAPTGMARENLLREGVPDSQVIVTGNTVIDALQMEVRRQQSPSVRRGIEQHLAELVGSDWNTRPYVLVTGHRRENFGNGLDEICLAIRSLADRFPEYRFVYPVHLNPNVQKPVREQLGSVPNIRLIAPQDYAQFIALLNNCRLVLTDSGGVQEEAPALGKPVLVMRDTTERPEGIRAGTVAMVGANAHRITDQVGRLLTDARAYRAMAEAVNPYGDGKAAPRIVERMLSFFRERELASKIARVEAEILAVTADRPVAANADPGRAKITPLPAASDR